MRHIRRFPRVLLVFIGALIVLVFISVLNSETGDADKHTGSYLELAPDTATDNATEYITRKFKVKSGFHSNLPIVIMSLDSEIPDYKSADESGREIINPGVEPYTTGNILIIDNDKGENTLRKENEEFKLDNVVYESRIKIKKKGHSSYAYDKPQYKIKAVLQDGEDNDTSILGMGEGSEWVLNGSMADKSMLRNYLAYRIASEIGGNNMAPDSRFCELMTEEEGKLKYQGVYMLIESVSRGNDRIDIGKYDPRNRYSPYIVRRDRKTVYDIMLDTYGRQAGIGGSGAIWETDNWIGLKYPSAAKVTNVTVDYIEKDFSTVEKVLYSDKISLFRQYGKFIDVDSFADYFLINEYFGNYDAGLHSTYMYKDIGERLSIGPVWDFDQAMDNNMLVEMKPEDLAMQTATFYKELCRDRQFISELEKRYRQLSRSTLSTDHVFSIIDEATAYLRSAQKREWYRWAEDYMDDSAENPHNYNLEPYRAEGELLSRFNDEYDQEIDVIKYYLNKHSKAILPDLAALYRKAKIDTASGGMRELIFIAAMFLLFVPAYLINRRE